MDFATFFKTKVEGIRQSTSNAAPPTYTSTTLSVFSAFSKIEVEDIIKLICNSPNKHCDLDPLPTWLLKRCVDVLAPIITAIINKSLDECIVPLTIKMAIIAPRLKKSNLEPSDPSNYRPVSNLSLVSKLLERVVSGQITSYLNDHNLLPQHQSAYHKSHSTETALAKVYSDAVKAVDRGEFVLLALLDLSAAFDTVDHGILLERLHISFGIRGEALQWFRSYLDNRTQSVRYGGTSSPDDLQLHGVPQGSVLGPLLFVLYTADVESIVSRHGVSPHIYADDSQLQCHAQLDKLDVCIETVINCIRALTVWMTENRLKLNPNKTEFMWCASARRQHLIDSAPFIFDGIAVNVAAKVRNLGVTLDSDLTLKAHVSRLVSSCFFELRQLKCCRRSLPIGAARTLVNSFIVSRLDYCNVVLAGCTKIQLDRLQAIFNATARMIYG